MAKFTVHSPLVGRGGGAGRSVTTATLLVIEPEMFFATALKLEKAPVKFCQVNVLLVVILEGSVEARLNQAPLLFVTCH